MSSAADAACCDAGVYEAWRRNVPYTYDWLCSTFLEWGSLSADFLGVRPLSMAASLRLKAGGDPAKLAATSALVGKAGVAEADLLAKGAYMRGFVFATRTGEIACCVLDWGGAGRRKSHRSRGSAASRCCRAFAEQLPPPHTRHTSCCCCCCWAQLCPLAPAAPCTLVSAPGAHPTDHRFAPDAQCPPLGPADAAFDASRGEWEGIPCWLTVADAVVQRPHTSQPHGLKRIAHATGSTRILPRRRIVHPGEVNKVR